jgi:hypothetical protein
MEQRDPVVEKEDPEARLRRGRRKKQLTSPFWRYCIAITI